MWRISNEIAIGKYLGVILRMRARKSRDIVAVTMGVQAWERQGSLGTEIEALPAHVSRDLGYPTNSSWSDLGLARTIVDSAGIIVTSEDMITCYDERGANMIFQSMSWGSQLILLASGSKPGLAHAKEFGVTCLIFQGKIKSNRLRDLESIYQWHLLTPPSLIDDVE